MKRHLLLWALTATLNGAVVGVDAIRITVSDLGKAGAFYQGTLGFAKVSASPYRMRLSLGSESIELASCGTAGRPYPADSRSNDLWFQHIAIIVSDFDAAYRVLRRAGVRNLSESPQTIPLSNPAAGGIRAYYFADPDGHPLEILWFPTGKGDPRWQDRSRLFLGIDHTAIAVSNTSRSLEFYQVKLGMKKAGASFNYGIEQERLSGVSGARVRITALRAPRGPGIEFLEYEQPLTGRANPADDSGCDIVRRETVMVSDEETGEFRDPDGHLVRLIPHQAAGARLHAPSASDRP